MEALPQCKPLQKKSLDHGRAGPRALVFRTPRPGALPSLATRAHPLPRLEAVDFLRGLAMVLMTLDHVRDFLSVPGVNPLDLRHTNLALFFVRWTTHFCAPVFILLAGTGAFLSLARGRTRPQLTWFLLTRGFWLVALEFTVIHFGWSFRLDYRLLLGQVLWAIGCAMMALAGLVFLPPAVVFTLGVLLLAGHNLGDTVALNDLGMFRHPWKILESGGFLSPHPGMEFHAAYPLLPWLGVMMVGYGCGGIWLHDRSWRRRCLLAWGVGLLLLFVALRAWNHYGDPHPWAPQRTGSLTALSFLNCTKYPPSLAFLLMTLGIALVQLAWWDRPPGRLRRVVGTFGRVPLFFYLLHLPFIHLLAVGLAYVRFGEAGFLFQNIFLARAGVTAAPLPPGYGYGLLMIFVVWLAVLLLLYFPSRWFAGFKQRHRSTVWRYL